MQLVDSENVSSILCLIATSEVKDIQNNIDGEHFSKMINYCYTKIGLYPDLPRVLGIFINSLTGNVLRLCFVNEELFLILYQVCNEAGEVNYHIFNIIQRCKLYCPDLYRECLECFNAEGIEVDEDLVTALGIR